MKVTGIRTVPFSCERERLLGDANLPEGTSWQSHVAVIVDTDAGLVGSSVANPGTEAAVAALAEIIIGEDPAGVRGLWEKMSAVLWKRGVNGLSGQAVAAIDIALWDLKAKERTEPLWRTLGATHQPVGAYASGIDMPLTDEELHSYYRDMAGLGFTAGKLKVGLDQAADLRRLGIVRDALIAGTGKATLIVDANEFWSAKQAIRRIREMEQHFDIAWVEEPVDRLDGRALHQVSAAVSAAVATGENLTDTRSFMSLIDREGVDVVQPNVLCGGFTGVLQVCELAYAHNLPVAMVNCPGHVLAHVAALFPNHWLMEVLDPNEPAVIRSSVQILDGAIHLGDAPGHGMWFDEDELQAHRDAGPHEGALSSRYRRSPDARRHETGRQPKS